MRRSSASSCANRSRTWSSRLAEASGATHEPGPALKVRVAAFLAPGLLRSLRATLRLRFDGDRLADRAGGIGSQPILAPAQLGPHAGAEARGAPPGVLWRAADGAERGRDRAVRGRAQRAPRRLRSARRGPRSGIPRAGAITL